MRLEDKVALIIGCSPNIGRSIARIFAKAGASVTVNDTTFSVMSKFMRRAGFCGPVDLLWRNRAVVFITTVIVMMNETCPYRHFPVLTEKLVLMTSRKRRERRRFPSSKRQAGRRLLSLRT